MNIRNAGPSKIVSRADGRFQIVYPHHNIVVATAPFETFEGGIRHLRRLIVEGKILGEVIGLLNNLRYSGIRRASGRMA